ncbi:hypothetical protein M0Q97_08080 [Candidatus Dojkabacteria bacterium]|jgi:hypothetical protein|nr:hypothetical protein [Candidatus Dojkabacteria bacterium]
MGTTIIENNIKTTVFIRKANKKHDNKYDYSKSIYLSNKEKLIIICPIHGEFLQTPQAHLTGSGCPKCGRIRSDKNEFIEKANQIHKNKYDYSESIYSNNTTRIIIKCLEHGEFLQTPQAHLKGQGCPKCGILKNQKSNTKDNLEFIEEANKVHKRKYDYSKTNYMFAKEKVTITCPIHGDFEQRACNHLNGSGCPKCSNLKTLSEFIEKANKVHKGKYDYSKTLYNHSEEKVIIICPIHGEFLQQANSHLNGYGCPECAKEISISSYEIKLQDFIKSLNIDYVFQDRKILNGQELDIFIPSKKVAIEFNGLYWHSELKKDKKYHLQKTIECEKQNIQLIHIFEDEWISKQDIVKSRLLNILGKTENIIYARKCEIKEIDRLRADIFLETNHIQGFINSRYYYGLFYQEQLVSVMTFGKLRKNLGQRQIEEDSFELLRFCNKLNTSVVGGASKLFKFFINNVKPKKVKTYADRRWSIGNLYDNLGFTFSHNSEVNYFYIMGQNRKNRFNFRKDILIKEYGCTNEDTEHNFCFNQGWYRIYDCGTKVYNYHIN